MFCDHSKINIVEKKNLKNYAIQLTNCIENIDYEVVQDSICMLENCNKNGGSIYVIGNGGSASTASHMVSDLGIGLKRRGVRNFDIKSLADNLSVITAIGNDIGYENIFYAQLENILKADDVLIAISCSGNSANIIKAVKYAKKQGGVVLAFTGFDGGLLKEIADINFHVETEIGAYGIVEDLHLIFNHMVYNYFLNSKQGKKR